MPLDPTTRRRWVPALRWPAILVFWFAASLSLAASPPRLPDHVPGEILIRLRPTAGPADRAAVRARVAAGRTGRFRSGAERWRLGNGRTVEEAIARLRGHPLVVYVEPNYIVSAAVRPDDDQYGKLYGLHNEGQTGGTPGADIDAERAWNLATGSADVVVAVIDSGMDLSHPDLAGNLWTNPGEIAGNGVDDDGNGFVDDVHGWDFVNGDNDPSDDRGHGTHVAGIIGAVGNNSIGVTGVAWDVSLVPLKFLATNGFGSIAHAVQAIDYATFIGADVANNSWCGGDFSQTLLDAIQAADDAGVVFTAAAGNASGDNDLDPSYPASYDVPNIISVAATDHFGQLASFSNIGATSVDLAAPGMRIDSTYPPGTYGNLTGTSMATPYVSGTVALLRSIAPDMPPAEVRQKLLQSVIPEASLQGLTVTGGRLSAFLPLAEPDASPPGPVLDLSAHSPTSNSVFLSWTAPGDDGSQGVATSYRIYYSASGLSESTLPEASLLRDSPRPRPAGSQETVEVLGLSAETTYDFAVLAEDEWGQTGPLGNVVIGRTLEPPTLALSPGSFDIGLSGGRTTRATLSVRNAGTGTLDWRLLVPEIPSAASGTAEAEADLAGASLETEENEKSLHSGAPVATSAGGPDRFGYRWADSRDPLGPAFTWADIQLTGTPLNKLTGDDRATGPIPLGFSFSFYGETFNTVYIATNGILSLGEPSTAYGNLPIPHSNAPGHLIAPFWDDLRFAAEPRAAYATDGTTFTVQYTDVFPLGGPGQYTFQVSLKEDGEILFQYLRMTGPVKFSTVGIQNGTGSDGLQISYNSEFVRDRLAIRIDTVPPWLSAAPTSGRILAGEEHQATILLDAGGLAKGTHVEVMRLLTNDPLQPEILIPIGLQVGDPVVTRPLRADCLRDRDPVTSCPEKASRTLPRRR